MGNTAQVVGNAQAAPLVRSNWLPWLAGWRGLSIATVLIGHFGGDHFFAFGALGVEMFFVLSGRLIANKLFVKEQPFPEFFQHRISRVFPTLAVFLLITCSLSAALFHTGPMKAPFLLGLSSLLIFYNYVAALGHGTEVLNHLWSLCVEEHSYILLAILAVVVRRRGFNPRPVLLIATILSMLDGTFSNIVLKQTYVTGYWRTDAHIASMLLSAWCYLTFRARETPVAAWVGPVCAILGAVAINVHVAFSVWFTVGTALLAVGVNALDDASPAVKRALSGRILGWLGMLSYSIYLWQQPVFILTTAQWHMNHHHVIFLIPLTILLGFISYYAIEKPALEWINKQDLKWIGQMFYRRAANEAAARF